MCLIVQFFIDAKSEKKHEIGLRDDKSEGIKGETTDGGDPFFMYK